MWNEEVNMKKEQIVPIPLIIVKSQWWSKTVLSQIKRIEQNMNSEIYLDQVQRLADAHFLKIALKQLLNWIKELNKYVKETQKYIDSFNTLFDIKLLRDISEHELEYYKEIGNKQKEFINTVYNQSLLRCLIIDDIYYIGGKINMEQLKSILTELDVFLENSMFTYKIEAIEVLNDLMQETIV